MAVDPRAADPAVGGLPASFGELLGRVATERPDDVALIDPDGRWTWSQLREQVADLAAGLVAAGLRPEDRIAVQAPATAEFVLVYLAALQAGLVVVPVNPGYTLPELAHILTDSGARMLITSSVAAVGAADAAARRAPATGSGGGRRPVRSRRAGHRGRARGHRPTGAGRAAAGIWTAPASNWPCCFTPPAPPDVPRAPCCRSARCWPTSPRWPPCVRCRSAPRTGSTCRCRCSTSSASTPASGWRCTSGPAWCWHRASMPPRAWSNCATSRSPWWSEPRWSSRCGPASHGSPTASPASGSRCPARRRCRRSWSAATPTSGCRCSRATA